MKTNILLSAIIIAGLTFTGCKKEGCTDPDATTYDSGAKKDDGTCTYEGKVVFWYGATASAGLLADTPPATSLTIYVDGAVVGSSATSVFWTGSPECDQSGSVTVTKDMGGIKSLTSTYSVKDQIGYEYWSGIINFTANTCLAQELSW